MPLVWVVEQTLEHNLKLEKRQDLEKMHMHADEQKNASWRWSRSWWSCVPSEEAEWPMYA